MVQRALDTLAGDFERYARVRRLLFDGLGAAQPSETLRVRELIGEMVSYMSAFDYSLFHLSFMPVELVRLRRRVGQILPVNGLAKLQVGRADGRVDALSLSSSIRACFE